MDGKRYTYHCDFGKLRIDFTDEKEWSFVLHSKDGNVLARYPAPIPFQLPQLSLIDRNEIKGFTKNLTIQLPLALKAVKNVKGCQGHLLGLCTLGGTPAIELVEDCSAIAVLLAYRRPKNCLKLKEAQSIQRLVRKKRHQLLFLDSFPAQKWIVRLLKKIPADHACPQLLFKLKKILRGKNRDHIKVLRHLKQINSLVIEIMSDPYRARFMSPAFYHSLCTYPKTDDDIDVNYLLDELVRMSANPVEELNHLRLTNVRDLLKAHDLYAEYYNEDFSPDVIFPEPPVPEHIMQYNDGQVSIIPLSTAKILIQEGKRMKHCIASYGVEIATSGHLYAYHVSTLNEEATVRIKRDGKRWWMVEIRGKCNEKVTPETRYFVKQWLSNWNTNCSV